VVPQRAMDYFTHDSFSGRGRNVWRVRSTGGTSEQLTLNGSGMNVFESADGRHIIYKPRDVNAPLLEASLTGDAVRTIATCVGPYRGFRAVGEAIYYEPCGPARAGTIYVLDATTGRPRLWAVVPDVDTAYLWDLAISPDGTSLLYDRYVNFRANLWMLENFR
jgi:hypothetical protein